MNKVKVIGIGLIGFVLVGLAIHVPVSQLELVDAHVIADSYSSTADAFLYILELNFTGSQIVIVFHAKVTWELSGVRIAEDIKLSKNDDGLWVTPRFEVPQKKLIQALGAGFASGSFESTFIVTWNYYNTITYTLDTTINNS